MVAKASVNTATKSSSSSNVMIITIVIILAKTTKVSRIKGLRPIHACTVVVTIGTRIVGTGSNNPLVTSIVWISSSTICRLLRLMYQRRLQMYIPTVLNTVQRVSKIYAIRILAFDGLS
jgi:Na+/H+ antiporter NhaB